MACHQCPHDVKPKAVMALLAPHLPSVAPVRWASDLVVGFDSDRRRPAKR